MTPEQKRRLLILQQQQAQALAKPEAAMSWRGRLRDNLIGADDGIMSPGEKLAALLNKGGESMTFGLVGDEAAGAADALIGRGSYEDRRDFYRAQEQQLEAENPGLALTAEIGGAMLAPIGALGAIRQGAGVLNAAKQVGAAGAATGALSGLYGFMEGEGGIDQRAADAQNAATLGAVIGAAIPVVGYGVQKGLDGIVSRRAINQAARNAPTTEQLRAQGRAAYKAVDDLGVKIKASAFDNARRRIVDMLRAETAYSPRPGAQRLVPKTAAVMDDMAMASDQMAGATNAVLPFKELEGFRRQAGAAAGNVTDRADMAAGSKIIEGLDDFVATLGPGDVVRGDTRALSGAITKARKLWASMSKSQKLDDAMEAAENYRYGFSNGIKWQFKRILNNPKMARGFSESERAVMKRVINGSVPERALELMGSGLTSIGGIVGGGLGMAAGGLPGLLAGGAVTGASMLARKGADAVARNKAEIARRIIAGGQAQNLQLTANPQTRRLIEEMLRKGGAATAAQ